MEGDYERCICGVKVPKWDGGLCLTCEEAMFDFPPLEELWEGPCPE